MKAFLSILTGALAMALCSDFGLSAATTATWNNTAGNWSDGTRWSTNPLAPNNGNPAGVTYDAVMNIGSVSLDVPITIENFFLNGGTFSSASNQTLTLNQQFRWGNGGTFASGTIRPAGGVVITGAGATNRAMAGGTLINVGSGGLWQGSTSIGLQAGTASTLVNAAGATLDIQGDGARITTNSSGITGTAIFTNNGLLKKTGLAGTFSMDPTVLFNNSAQMLVSTGTVELFGGGTSVSGSSFATASGAVTRFRAGTYTMNGGTTLSGAGTLRLDGTGTINLAGAVGSPVGEVVFEMEGGTLTGAGPGTLAIETFRWKNGGKISGGTTTARGGILLTGGGSSRTMAGGTLINAGSGGLWEGSSTIGLEAGTASTLVNAAGATWDIQGVGAIATNSSGTTGTLIFLNDGLLKKTISAGTFDLGFGGEASFRNSGTADVQSGRMNIPKIEFNHGTLRASTGGLLTVGGSSLDNIGGLIETLSGSTVRVNDNSTIRGGRFNNIAGTFDFGTNVTLDGTVAGGTTFDGIFNIPLNRTVTVKGDMFNNGQMLLGPTGGNTRLLISGEVEFFGSAGRITLANGASIESAATGGPHSLINPQFIEGVGTVSVLLNNTDTGVIRGNVAGGTLSVGGATTNTGVIEARDGGTLDLLSSTVTNTAGLIQALAGSTVRLGGVVIGGEIINHSGGNLFSGSTLLDSATSPITLTGAYTIGDGRLTTLRGNLLNPAGHTFSLAGGSSGSRLRIDGPITLGGNYTVTLAGANSSIVRNNSAPNSADRLTNTKLIQGRGLIDVALTNNSGALVDANVTGQELHVGLFTANTGVLRASNGGQMRISGTVENAGGGVIRALGAGTEVTLTNARLEGGLLENGGGSIRAAGTNVILDGDPAALTLQGLYAIGESASTAFRGTIVNQTQVLLQSAAGSSTFLVDGPLALQGQGKITLSGPNSSIKPFSNVASDLLTNSQLLEGRGTVSARLNNLALGVIDANVNSTLLEFTQTLDNAGLLRASNGGAMTIKGGGSSTGNIEITQPESFVSFGGGNFLLEGDVNISGAGDAVVAGGTVMFGDSASDVINVTASSFHWQGGSLKGPGLLQLSPGSSSNWFGSPGNLDGLTINNPGLVEWAGSFGAVNGATINNSGTFNATGDHALTGTAASGTFNNSGTFRKSGGAATTTINVVFNNTGLVQVDSGVLALAGGGTHSGDFRADGTRLLQLIGGEHHLQNGVDFLGNGGLGQTRLSSNGVLRLASGAAATVAPGARLVIDSALLTGAGGDLLDVSGSLVLGVSAVMSGTGTTRINAGGEALFADGGTKSIEGRTLRNEGTTTWGNTAGGINVLKGGLIDNRGTFIVSNNSTLFGEQGATPARFENSGTLRKLGASGTSIFDIDFTNTPSGEIDIQSGKIDFTGNFENRGSMTVANSSSTISYGGGENGFTGKYEVGANGIITFNIAPGGSLVAQGGGNLVAQGGGNLVAQGGGNLVAQGGGNIVAQGGGNIVAQGGGNIVAQGGGNIVAQGGGNIVAQGGGNIVAQGGGNIVAQGGGNLVAQGGGNVIAEAGGSISGSGLIGMDGGSLIGMDGASIGPGLSPGILTLDGDLDLRDGSNLEIELNGLTVGTQYDRLDVNNGPTGSAIFDGNLLIEVLYGFRGALTGADQFSILTADTALGGTIDNLIGGRVTTQDGFGSFAVTYQNGGHDLVLSGFETVPLTYALWITGFDFEAGEEVFAADPDRDGMSNGLEYGLGSDALVPDLEAVPLVSVSEAVTGSGIRYLTLTYERPAGVNRPIDLVWNVQRNTDLTSSPGWSSAGLSAEEVTSSPGTGLETVVVRSQMPVGSAGLSTEFLRLTVTKP